MAKISGIIPGFVPKEKPVKPKPRKAISRKDYTCTFCGFVSSSKVRFTGSPNEYSCLGCSSYFGFDNEYFSRGGVTDLTFEEVKEKMDKLNSDSWVMVLKSGSFVSSSTGRTLTLELGDIFKVSRVSTERKPDGTSSSSMEKFSIDIQFGSEVLTLLPHEFSQVSWPLLIQLRSDGEIEETFLEDDDQWGMFQPNPEVRKMIINAFGR